MSMVYYHWASRSSETACVRAPASWLGGVLSGFVSTVGIEKQRPVIRLSCHASGAPPATSQIIIIAIIIA